MSELLEGIIFVSELGILKAIVPIIPNGFIKLLVKRLSKRGRVPEGGRLNCSVI